MVRRGGGRGLGEARLEPRPCCALLRSFAYPTVAAQHGEANRRAEPTAARLSSYTFDAATSLSRLTSVSCWKIELASRGPFCSSRS